MRARTTLLTTTISLAIAAIAYADAPVTHERPTQEVPAHARGVRCLDLTVAPSAAACTKHGGVLHDGPIPLPAPRPDTQAAARAEGARCADGTTAKATGRLACAKHGGPAPQESRRDEPAPQESRLGEPVARCRDGWVAYSARGGSCGEHGGVREWLGA